MSTDSSTSGQIELSQHSPQHDGNSVPPTKVLAIASHVVYGYVGNVMATFCMQALGCEVAAMNTVHFSNHTGYGQWTGGKTSPEEIASLYQGLRQSHLLDFDVLLSGYIPSAAALHEVAVIAKDLKSRNKIHTGAFFWVLDPVMGDQGRLYVSPDLVEGYKTVVKEADLVLPNQFELQLISGVDLGEEAGVKSLGLVKEAIQVLHTREGIRHVIATSVRVQNRPDVLYCVGSSRKTNGESRCFVVEVPVLDCYFSGTGDMFAGLMVGRLREACQAAGTLNSPGWMSSDEVLAEDLPLAKATERVLSSMNIILDKTMIARNEEVARWEQRETQQTADIGVATNSSSSLNKDEGNTTHLIATKAAEVRAVRNVQDLVNPTILFKAKVL